MIPVAKAPERSKRRGSALVVSPDPCARGAHVIHASQITPGSHITIARANERKRPISRPSRLTTANPISRVTRPPGTISADNRLMAIENQTPTYVTTPMTVALDAPASEVDLVVSPLK